MDEIELTKKQARGQRAEELLRNELLRDTLKKLEEEYTEAWKQTHFKDDDARQRLWQAVQIVRKVTEHLTKLVTDGKIATKDLGKIKYLTR